MRKKFPKIKSNDDQKINRKEEKRLEAEKRKREQFSYKGS